MPSTGNHSVSVDLSNSPAGTYQAILVVDGYIADMKPFVKL
ncbi:MAG: hypothetical protein ACPGVE_06460 [Flavobacteriales bacterium]